MTPATTEPALDPRKVQDILAFIDEVKGRPFPRSHLITVLHRAQESFGYLSKDLMTLVAGRLGIPLSTIYGVATFYHFFNLTPRGKYVISICLGTACYVKGGERVGDCLKEELGIGFGETTQDCLFTLLETRCLGACGQAPVMMMNGTVYTRLTPKKLKSILDRCRQEAARA